MNRRKIYDLVEPPNTDGQQKDFYDIFLFIVIIISIIPLAFKQNYAIFSVIDTICTIIFIVDYILRWITEDYRSGKNKGMAFILYPVTPMALVDLISILPGLTALNNGFKLLKIFRLIRTLRIFRIAKAFRYSKSINMIISVFNKQKEPLIAVCGISGAYVLISALVIFNAEPESFNTFFDAVYWATVSLTTVGYGDIYPVTTVGRIITMISSVFGIAIIAMPAGIITAGIMDFINADNKNK